MIWGVDAAQPASVRPDHVDRHRRGAAPRPACHAVLTHDDVPGLNRCGLEHADQPVLAEDVVRYQGEPVALVAADHPEIARRAAEEDPGRLRVARPGDGRGRRARGRRSALHPDGNLVRHLKLRKGAPTPPPTW